MEGEHIRMLARKNFVADANDQFVPIVIQTSAGMIRVGRAFFQDGVCGDHFPWNEVRSDAEVFEGALCLRSP
jgi:hypothetical protein